MPSVRMPVTMGAVVVALTLAACSAQNSSADAQVADGSEVTSTLEQDLARAPHAGVEPPVVEASDLLLPLQSEDADLVDPGWEVTPQYLDGIFMAPVEVDGHLEFTAIDADGTALWAVERPLACAGFTLTTGPDGPIAVINDAHTTDTAIAATSASAYDLRTGELVWGPVDVPGPHQGPGLVYAAPSEVAMGASGPRVALSSMTGETLADEADSGWSVVAENHATVLLSDGTALRALGADGSELWESALPAGLTSALAPSSTPIGAGVHALRGDDDSLTVINLETGTVLAQSVTSAAVDASTGTLIATDPISTMGVNIASGDIQWSTQSTAHTYVVTAGGAMAYVRDGEAIRVQNAITGDITPGYAESQSGVIAVPVVMTGTGTAAFAYEGRVLLATEPAR